MLELSQDAIRELRQSLPLLKRLVETLTKYHEHGKSPPRDEIWQLQNAYDRVSQLTSPIDVQTWVGIRLYTDQEEPPEWVTQSHKQISLTNNTESARSIKAHAERLYLYVQGILERENIEERLNLLTQENASLRQQLAELNQREQTYSSLIREAQTAASYEIPPESALILFQSSQRQHTLLTQRLSKLKEQQALYGIDTPPHILAHIEHTEEEIRQTEAKIADWKNTITWI